jgi:hypothetical protein
MLFSYVSAGDADHDDEAIDPYNLTRRPSNGMGCDLRCPRSHANDGSRGRQHKRYSVCGLEYSEA